MDSTTLKVELAGTVFYLSCRRREKFCIGSALDCKLSLDGKGILPEHCEVERKTKDCFLVRSLNEAPTSVNGVQSPEMEVDSPFTLGVGDYKILITLVPDEEAEGFEEIEEPEGDSQPRPYIVDYSEKKSDSTGKQVLPANPRGKTSPVKVKSEKVKTAPISPGTEKKDTTAKPMPLSRVSGLSRHAAIPAIRFGGLASGRDLAPKKSEPLVEESIYQAIELPLPGEHSTRKSRARDSPPVQSSTLPFKFTTTLLLLSLILGFAWFEWRKYSLPNDIDLLYQKAESGDHSAMATLGLSQLRGEWGAELNREEGIDHLLESARANNVFGLIAVAGLREEGFLLPEETRNPQQLCEAAIQLGLFEQLDSVNEPRLWTLAAKASRLAHGSYSDEALDWLNKAAHREYPEALAALASNSSDEMKSSTLWEKAEKSARRASGRGSVYSRRLLAQVHLRNDIPEADPRFGEEQMELAAQADDPVAQFEFARILEQQDGRTRGNEKAFDWMSRSSQSNFLPAIAGTADYLFEGIGTEPDAEEAERLAEFASAQGEPSAALTLAKVHAAKGDIAAATRRLQPLADSGNSEAISLLGEIFLKSGRESEAETYLRKSAESGDGNSAFKLGKILSKRTESSPRREGIHWLEEATRLEVSGAATALAETIDDPDREDRNPKRAVELLQSFSDSGDQASSVRLSEYYLSGRGVEKNPGRALLLLQKAADEGESSGWYPLGKLLESGIEGILAPGPASAIEAYQKSYVSGDQRIFERFPVLQNLDSLAESLVESWEADSPADTIRHLAPSPEQYLHITRPDASQIASLETGFRLLWPHRDFSAAAPGRVTIESTNSISFKFPVSFTLAREKRRFSGESLYRAEITRQSNGAWKFANLAEDLGTISFLPGEDRFFSGEHSRTCFPAIPVGESTYDPTKLPQKQVDYVKSFPFTDRFGSKYSLIPTGTKDELIVFTNIANASDLLIPRAYFDESSLDSIDNMIGSQSFDIFEKEFASITMKRLRDRPAANALFASADAGNNESQALVGERYYEGLDGFPFDRVEALKWFVRSARGKHPLGRYWLAVMTASGEITAPDSATTLFRNVFPDMAPLIATNNPRPEHWRATGECYAEGEKLTFGEGQSRELLERAIKGGDQRARLLLGNHFIETDFNLTDGLRHLRTAADAGCSSAAVVLGNYYLGPGKSPELAAGLFHGAAKQNNPTAQFVLGNCYSLGKGFEPDQARAAFWLHLSLKNSLQQGNKDLEAKVREMIRILEPKIGIDNYRRAQNFLEKKLP